MASRLYLRRGETLEPLAWKAFRLEDLLQELVEKYPQLVAGDTAEDEDRRWLCISREASVPDGSESPGRWSLDHLIVNDLAVPTLVEAKLASNTEVRRQIVGQMFEYAANASAYWDIASFRQSWEASVRERGGDPAETLVSALQVEEPDVFWKQVDDNLRAGQIRLVFVADGVPLELQRIVEFLNERMVPTEVLAVDIRQYPAGEEMVLTRRVLGQTVAATDRKNPRPPKKTQADVRQGFADLPEDARTAGLQIFDHLAGAATRYDGAQTNDLGGYFYYEQGGGLLLMVYAWIAAPNKASFGLPFSMMATRHLPQEQLDIIARRFTSVLGSNSKLERVIAGDANVIVDVPLQDMIANDGIANDFCRAVDDIARSAGRAT